jgi:hypothetical protein
MAEVKEILKIDVNFDDAIKSIMMYKDRLAEVRDEQKKLTQTYKDDIGALKKKGASQDDLNSRTEKYRDELGTLIKEEEAYRQGLQTSQRVMRAQVREQKNAEGSLEQLRGELSKATAEYDRMSKTVRDSTEGIDLKNKINTITKDLKLAEEGTERFYRNVGNYENAIKNAVFGNSQFGNSLMNISDSLGEGGIGNALNNAKASVMGFGKAALGLMANPAFLAIAGIAGAGAAFKFWWDYNEGLEKASMLTQQYTGLTGNDMKQVRTEVQSLADMFGKDFGEVLQAANSMSKQFGISMSEAISNLEEGFLRGGDASGEMLDNIREYSTHFKEAGLSADDMLQISINATKQGVFSDKGLDAIKEANIRLREMPKATQDALAGLGLNVNEIMKGLRDGSLSTFEVMQQVSGKLDEMGENAPETGAAIADIFGIAGEDAGLAYLTTLQGINTELDLTEEKTDEVTEAKRRQLEADQELDKAVAALFDRTGGGFEKMKADITTMYKTVLKNMIVKVIELANYFIELYNESTAFRLAIAHLKTPFIVIGNVVKGFFKLMMSGIKGTGDAFKAFGKMIEGIIKFDIDKIKEGWNDLTKGIADSFSRSWDIVATTAVDGWEKISNNIRNAINGEKIPLIEIPATVVVEEEPQGKGGKGGNGGNGGGNGGNGGSGGSKKTKTEITENELNNMRFEEVVQQVVEVRFEVAEKTVQQADKTIDAEINKLNILLRVAKDNAEERKNIELQLLDLEYQEKVKKATEEIANEEQRNQTLIAMNLEYQQQKTDIEDKYTEERKQIAKTEFETKAAAAEAIGSIMGGLSSVMESFGEENKKAAKAAKVMAIGEIAVNTGVAIAKGVKEAQSVPFPGNLVAIATTITTILANVASAISTVKSAKFAHGGLVSGAGTATSDSIPARLSNGESVLTAAATSMFAPALSAFNQIGGGVPIVVHSPAEQMGQEFLAAAVAKGMAAAPAPVVSVEEIDRVGRRVKALERIGTL